MPPLRLRLSKCGLPHFVFFTRRSKGILLNAEEFKSNKAIVNCLATENAAPSPFEFSVSSRFGILAA
jgi:hypothetical protein